jgi:putative flippase GtrA
MRFTDGRVARFLVAGLINTALSYVAYLLLLRVAEYRVAFSIAFIAGLLMSYGLNARFVFRRSAHWRSFTKFPLVYVAQYLAGLALVSFLVEWLGMPAWLAPVVVLTVTVPLTYLLVRAIFVRGGSE